MCVKVLIPEEAEHIVSGRSTVVNFVLVMDFHNRTCSFFNNSWKCWGWFVTGCFSNQSWEESGVMDGNGGGSLGGGFELAWQKWLAGGCEFTGCSGRSRSQISFVPLFGGPVVVKKQLRTMEVQTQFARAFSSKLSHVQSQLLLCFMHNKVYSRCGSRDAIIETRKALCIHQFPFGN